MQKEKIWDGLFDAIVMNDYTKSMMRMWKM